MKFARYLEETQIPEWKKAYINYRLLKKRIAAIRKAEQSQDGTTPLLAPELSRSPVASSSGAQPRHSPSSAGAGPSGRSYGSTGRSPPLKRQREDEDNEGAQYVDRDGPPPPPVLLPPPAIVHETSLVHGANQSLVVTSTRPKGNPYRDISVKAHSETSVPRISASDIRLPQPTVQQSLESVHPANSSNSSRLNRAPSRLFKNLRRRSSWMVRGQTLRPQQHLTLTELLPLLSPVQRQFFDALDAELDKIETFFCERQQEASIRLSTLKEQLHELKEHRKLYYEAQESELRHSSFKGAIAIRFRPHLDRIVHITHPSTNIPPPPPAGPSTPDADRDDADRDGNAKKVVAIAASVLKPKHDPDDYQHAKKRLKKAVLEYYRGLELLNNFRILNLTGFRKALKKFEKATRILAQEAYIKEKVEICTFASGDTLESMLRDMESLYAARFERGDAKKARTRLRATAQQTSHHFSTFRTGLLLGLGIPPLVHGIYECFQPATQRVMPSWGPLLFVYGVLLIPNVFALLVGFNLLVWSRARINYQFIFELDVRTQLDCREYLELPSLLLAAFCYAFWLSFARIGTDTVASTTWPLIWIGFVGIVMFNPLPLYFKPSRFWLTHNIGKLLISGTRHVEFTDFWMGDQFCSLIFTLANLYFVGCAYSVHWIDVWSSCSTSHDNWAILTALAILPLVLRMVQSVKRWFDSRLITHLINGGKYGSSTLMYILYYNWRRHGSQHDTSFAVWCIFATFASIYTTSWDLWMDWSVMRPHERYPFLRNELVYSNYLPLYYFAIVSNILLRFAWVIYLAEGPNVALLSFVAGSLEMLRRWQWNFLRLENEHLGNTDQYRVTREVPLPYTFNEAVNDSDDADEDESVNSKLSRRKPRSVHLPTVQLNGELARKYSPDAERQRDR